MATMFQAFLYPKWLKEITEVMEATQAKKLASKQKL